MNAETTKKIPTVEQIEELAAKACGWLYREEDRSWQTPQGEFRFSRWPYPRYLTDQNALPELLTKVEAAGVGALEVFCLILWANGEDGKMQYGNSYAQMWPTLIQMTQPQRVVLAALRALNMWPADWEMPGKTP